MDPIREQLAELNDSAFGWAMVCCHRDRDVAVEVLHKAYCRILGGDAEFKGKAKFSTWVFGVIRNIAREETRRQQRDRERFQQNFELAADAYAFIHRDEQSSEQKELASRLRTAMQELSDRQRELLHLTFYQDMTVEQAAEVLQISVGSARQHYHRAKAALRQKLGNTRELER